VLLTRRGTTPDVAKVVDFGLVQSLADTPATQVIAGTPRYIAPEAVTEPSAVGPAADLYSLGAVGYYLLTGHPVFDGETLDRLCVQHATQAPVAPSERTDNPIPKDLEALILACLAKDPAKRPASAAALRLALRRLPEAEDWDETAAHRWWDEFYATRVEPTVGSHGGTPQTITITIAPRTPAE
jgi:serine/threonine-protein kinase